MLKEKIEKGWQPKYKYTFAVAPLAGPRAFPLDMLRYDGCTFADESSANMAADTIRIDGGSGALANIRLVKLFVDGAWTPNWARWQSYGWREVLVQGALG